MRVLSKAAVKILVLVIVFSLAAPSIAMAETRTEKVSEESRLLYELGVLKGDGGGVDNTYVTKNSARIQAAILQLRLLGREEKALSYTGTEKFADITVSSFQKPILAYLKANPDLGWRGDNNGLFHPDALLTAQEYYKVLLTVLGYKQNVDFEWKDTISFAKSKGLFAAPETEDKFTNSDLAKATVNALKTKIKGSEITLADQIAATNSQFAAKAMLRGLLSKTGSPGAEGSIMLGNIKADRILFLGNSITLSPPGAAPGWNNNFGMAASTRDNDYVHLITNAIASYTGNTPDIMVNNIAEPFERGYTKEIFNAKEILTEQLAFKPDIVIVELGANVFSSLSSADDMELYKQKFIELLNVLKDNGNPEIFVTGCIIGENMAAKDSAMKSAAESLGCTFVDTSDFIKDPQNLAHADGIYSDKGVLGHPGDKGMRYIAERILSEMLIKSGIAKLPEPLQVPEAKSEEKEEPRIVNLISNPGFEEDEGWIAFNDTVTWSKDIVHSGEKAFSLSKSQGGLKSTGQMKLDLGKTYSVSVWVYGKTQIVSALFDKNNSYLGEYAYLAEGGEAGKWTKLECTLIIENPDIGYFDIEFVPLDEKVIIDDVSVTINP